VVGIDTVRIVIPRLKVPRNDRVYGGPMTAVRQFQVTFDCAEPERVARF
jgi:hypothetical protein